MAVVAVFGHLLCLLAAYYWNSSVAIYMCVCVCIKIHDVFAPANYFQEIERESDDRYLTNTAERPSVMRL